MKTQNKLIVSEKQFAQALQIASKIVRKDCILPILGNFLIVVEKNWLSVRATDLENSIAVNCECEAGKDYFMFVLPASQLKLFNAKSEKSVVIIAQRETFSDIVETDRTRKVAPVCSLEIEMDNERITMETEDFGDFPKFPEGTIAGIAGLDKSFFTELKLQLPYMSNDDLRPAMTGVFMDVNKERVELCATDAHLLRRTNFPPFEFIKENRAILAKECCQFLCSFKSIFVLDYAMLKQEGKFPMAHFAFRFANMDINFYSRTIDANYPDYNAVIPKDKNTTVFIDRELLIYYATRAMLYVNNTIQFQGDFIFDNTVKLSCNNLDFNKSYRCEFDYYKPKEGAGLEVCLNLKFLLGVLKTITTDIVTIELVDHKTAVIIREGESVVLLMPIRNADY